MVIVALVPPFVEDKIQRMLPGLGVSSLHCTVPKTTCPLTTFVPLPSQVAVPAARDVPGESKKPAANTRAKTPMRLGRPKTRLPVVTVRSFSQFRRPGVPQAEVRAGCAGRTATKNDGGTGGLARNRRRCPF